MQQRLDWIVKPPEKWCHWEPVRGGMKAHSLLRERYPEAECTMYEPVAKREAVAQEKLGSRWWQLSRWKGAAAQVGEPADGSMDMLWANMLLHTAGDPQTLIERWHKALKVDGYVMFSALGPDTVQQLHRLYAELGLGPAGHAFTDMHDWGDMLVHSGFAEPVMDMERITLSYSGAAQLRAELRELGRNLHPARFGGLRGRQWRNQLDALLTAKLADAQEQGRLVVSFEIIYGHAFKPTPRMKVQGESSISVQDMQQMLRQGRPGGA